MKKSVLKKVLILLGGLIVNTEGYAEFLKEGTPFNFQRIKEKFNSEKKTLLFVEPCLSSHLLLLKANQKGYNTIVLTAKSDSRKIPDYVLNQSSAVFIVDTNQDERVLNLVDKIAQEFEVHAVLPGSEYYVPLTAKISQKLKVLGLTEDAALGARRKDIMLERLSSKGVQIPKFKIATNEEELEKSIDSIGLPCVLKPVDFAGSVNVKKVTSIEEAKELFKKISENEGVDPSWGKRPIQRSVIIEEYIKGPEFSIEGFVKDGKVFIVAITEKLLSSEVDFVEVGHIINSQPDKKLHEQLQAYLTEVSQALNLTFCPFHAEVRVSDKGLFLMEIAARLAGDYIPKLIEYAIGTDYYNNTIRLLLGLPLDIEGSKKEVAGITFFYKPEVKTLSSNSYLDAALKDPNVVEVKPYYKVGDQIPDFPLEKHKLAYAIVVNKDYDLVKSLIKKLELESKF